MEQFEVLKHFFQGGMEGGLPHQSIFEDLLICFHQTLILVELLCQNINI